MFNVAKRMNVRVCPGFGTPGIKIAYSDKVRNNLIALN